MWQTDKKGRCGREGLIRFGVADVTKQGQVRQRRFHKVGVADMTKQGQVWQRRSNKVWGSRGDKTRAGVTEKVS